MSAGADLDKHRRAYLDHAPRAIVICRQYGHAWEPPEEGQEDVYTVRGRGRDMVYEQTVVCHRCQTTGVDTYDPQTMERIGSRSMDYTEGYLFESHGNGPLSRQEVRLYQAAKMRSRTNGARKRARK